MSAAASAVAPARSARPGCHPAGQLHPAAAGAAGARQSGGPCGGRARGAGAAAGRALARVRRPVFAPGRPEAVQRRAQLCGRAPDGVHARAAAVTGCCARPAACTHAACVSLLVQLQASCRSGACRIPWASAINPAPRLVTSRPAATPDPCTLRAQGPCSSARCCSTWAPRPAASAPPAPAPRRARLRGCPRWAARRSGTGARRCWASRRPPRRAPC